MKLLLHIGCPKTGTTTIQNSLKFNNKKSIENGFFYLTLENIRNIFDQKLEETNAHLLSVYFNNNHSNFKKRNLSTFKEKEDLRVKILNQYKDKIKTIPNNIHTVIISSEQFYENMDENNLPFLKTFLNYYFNEIKIICYIRQQVDTANSYFSTKLLLGWLGSQDFEQALNKDLVLDNITYNYFKGLLRWEDTFGRENIFLKIYDKTQFVNNELINDFINIIDKNLIENLKLQITKIIL